MKLRRLAAILLCATLLSAGCQPMTVPVMAVEAVLPTAAPTASPTPSPSPSPTPSPTPTPTPTPSPTPTPEPTPTPDPWAKHFSPEGPYLCIRDADKGPWIYRDETLSIKVTIPQSGPYKKQYYLAEIYSRGPLPFKGFAKKNPKATSVELPYKIAREYNAVLAITGEYIAARYNPKGVILCNGQVYHDKDKATTMAFLPSGEMKVFEPGKINAEKLLGLGVVDSFSFGPILASGGKCHPGITKHKLGTGRALRAAIGQVEPGHNIIIVTKNGITLTDLAKLFLQYKCKTAYNMDGGHSAALIFMGEQLNKNDNNETQQRGLPDMLMIGTCSAVPDVKDPVYGSGVYHYHKNKPKPTDGLIQ